MCLILLWRGFPTSAQETVSMQLATPVVTSVGSVDDPNTRPVRIVHISDTHGRHNHYLPSIPHGDILVHSGDFGCYAFPKLFRSQHHFNKEIKELNDFFSRVPHKHVVFVAGNHELHFSSKSTEEVQASLPHCHYLQDSSVTLEGIKFYGAAWNGKRFSSLAREFSVNYGKTLGHHWENIPDDVDVMVTHSPMHGVLDLSKDKSLIKDGSQCRTCGESHPGWWHWGCEHLRATLVNRVRPQLHLFGHCHERNGVTTEEGIVFSNAAMKLTPQVNVLDLYVQAASDTAR